MLFVYSHHLFPLPPTLPTPANSRLAQLKFQPDATRPKTRTEMSLIEYGTISGKPVVLKRIQADELANREIETLRLIELWNVPYTIRLLASFKESGREFANVLLFNEYQRLPAKFDSMVTLQHYTKQLLSTLKCLHDHKLVHLDLTKSNILLDASKNEIVIVDFGLARQCDGTVLPLAGTPGYIAPGLISQTSTSTAPDIYTSGIVFGEWLNPFLKEYKLSHHLGVDMFGSKLLRPNWTEKVVEKLDEFLMDRGDNFIPKAVYLACDLLAKMVVSDPHKRITAEKALQHPFILLSERELMEANKCLVELSPLCSTMAKRMSETVCVLYRG